MGTVGSEHRHKAARYNALSCLHAGYPTAAAAGEKHVVGMDDGTRLYFRFLCFDQRRIDVLVCTSVCWYTVPRSTVLAFTTRETITRIRTWYTWRIVASCPRERPETFGARGTRVRWIAIPFVFEQRPLEFFPFEAQLALHSFRGSVPLVADCECTPTQYDGTPFISIEIFNQQPINPELSRWNRAPPNLTVFETNANVLGKRKW